MCSKKPPKPDPAIGEAARANAELGKQQFELAKEQLAWEKERAAQQDPLIQKIVNQQIEAGETNAARSESQWQTYRDLFAPMEERMVRDAEGFDSAERKARMAAEAGADVTRAYQGATDQNQRAMERMGVNPNSGRFQALTREAGLAQARDTAGAMNKARRDTELQGMAMRQNAAQFGRNMPTTGIAADAAALQAGNSATSNIAGQSNIRNANLAAAGNWFGQAAGANTSAGNLMLGQHRNQIDAWAQNEQNKANSLAGLGSLAGMGMTMLPGLRKGGVIKRGMTYPPRLGGLQRLGGLRRIGYQTGGLVEGPGTATSDSVPAIIEDVGPARLSNGEAVLNKEAVDIVGEDFVHRINAAGLSGGLRTMRGEMMEGEG